MALTPKEKALELYSKFEDSITGLEGNEWWNSAKQCAVVSIDFMLEESYLLADGLYNETYAYWEEVKEEILKSKEEVNENIIKSKEEVKTVVNKAITKATSLIKYLMQHHQNVPPIKKISDKESIKLLRIDYECPLKKDDENQ